MNQELNQEINKDINQEIKSTTFKKKRYFKPRNNNAENQNDLEQNEEINENIIYGRNPVLEALKSDRKIDKLLVLQGSTTGSISPIVAKAKDKKIPVVFVQKSKLDEITTKNHQGVICYVPATNYVEVDEIISYARQKNEDPFIIILDELTDTANVGAIIRTSECCGVHGVIIPKRRSASMNGTVAKTSCGAIEYMKIAQVTNISQTIDKLKNKGIWVIGADMDGESIHSANLKGPCAFVIGAEGKGIGQLVKSKCDFFVKIPMVGNIKSLNASVAAGVILYEKFRQEL